MPPSSDDNPRHRADDKEFLFSELAVDPPLVEFLRICDKKDRAFETNEDVEQVARYRRAFELGAQKLRKLLGEEEDAC
ncbi:MAG: hypothetical protein AAF581_15300 [Planctomycetota bacterium]